MEAVVVFVIAFFEELFGMMLGEVWFEEGRLLIIPLILFMLSGILSSAFSFLQMEGILKWAIPIIHIVGIVLLVVGTIGNNDVMKGIVLVMPGLVMVLVTLDYFSPC